MEDSESWSRRQILAVVSSIGLSGCSTLSSDSPTSSVTSTRSPTDTTRTRSPNETTTQSSTTTDTTTATEQAETCSGSPESTASDTGDCCPFGAWYETSPGGVTDWRITVSGLETITSLELPDSDKEYAVADDTKLAIITTKIHNTSSSGDTWRHAHDFVIPLSDGSIAKPQPGYEPPESSEFIEMEEMKQIEHAAQYSAEGGPVQSDEIRRFWWIVPIPRSTNREEIRIGFAPEGNPVCWKGR